MSRVTDALDLAVLKPTANLTDILTACEFVARHKIHAICVAPTYAQFCVKQNVRTCTVVGFPHGTSTSLQKRNEAIEMVACGVQELDIVINYGRFLSGDLGIVECELRAIHDSIPALITTKAILETCYYSEKQIKVASQLCVSTGVDFVKTSTGFGLGGATEHDVKIMLDIVKGTKTQVKASGGIKSYVEAIRFLDLGCTRLGASQLPKNKILIGRDGSCDILDSNPNQFKEM